MNALPYRPWILAALLAVLVGWPSSLSAQRRPNIQLTFRIVEANGFEKADPEIEDIVEDLQEIFRFEGYRLLSTSVINTIPYADFSQALSSPQGDRFGLMGEISDDEEGDQYHRLQVQLVEVTDEEHDGLLQAAVNLRDGQTVVLGSARPTPEAAALILVVTARFSY